jgi:hypothetical protein
MSNSLSCPSCGAAASGNFCASCGTALGARHCTQCGHALAPDSRFCTQCGTAVVSAAAPVPASGAAGARSASSTSARTSGTSPRPAQTQGAGASDSRIGWWAAAGLFIALTLVVAWPILRPDQVGPGAGGGSAGASPVAPTGAAAVDLSQMTPREAADRLFARVMSAAEQGDSTQAMQFLPMAVQAYERAQPLDLDGLFHLSSLQRTGMDLEGALATAQGGLDVDPDHLLLLHAAGEAAREQGDSALAQEYFAHIIEVYDEQMASGNADYDAHSSMMASLRANARQFAGG